MLGHLILKPPQFLLELVLDLADHLLALVFEAASGSTAVVCRVGLVDPLVLSVVVVAIATHLVHLMRW